MEISTRKDGTDVTVVLKGDLDVYSASAAEEALKAAMTTASRVIVDLSEVPFADSSGLGGLISAYKAAKDQGKEVRLRKPTPIVSEILTITRMKRFFPVDE